jgi:hypothetical protein
LIGFIRSACLGPVMHPCGAPYGILYVRNPICLGPVAHTLLEMKYARGDVQVARLALSLLLSCTPPVVRGFGFWVLGLW